MEQPQHVEFISQTSIPEGTQVVAVAPSLPCRYARTESASSSGQGKLGERSDGFSIARDESTRAISPTFRRSPLEDRTAAAGKRRTGSNARERRGNAKAGRVIREVIKSSDFPPCHPWVAFLWAMRHVEVRAIRPIGIHKDQKEDHKQCGIHPLSTR
jgi:hypothetical protein